MQQNAKLAVQNNRRMKNTQRNQRKHKTENKEMIRNHEIITEKRKSANTMRTKYSLVQVFLRYFCPGSSSLKTSVQIQTRGTPTDYVGFSSQTEGKTKKTRSKTKTKKREKEKEDLRAARNKPRFASERIHRGSSCYCIDCCCNPARQARTQPPTRDHASWSTKRVPKDVSAAASILSLFEWVTSHMGTKAVRRFSLTKKKCNNKRSSRPRAHVALRRRIATGPRSNAHTGGGLLSTCSPLHASGGASTSSRPRLAL